MKKILIALVICFVALLLIGPLVFRDNKTTVNMRNTDESSEVREKPEIPQPEDTTDTGKTSPEPEKVVEPPPDEDKSTDALPPVDIITDQPVAETPPESPIVATEIPEKPRVSEAAEEDKPVPREKAVKTDDAGLFPFDSGPAPTPEPTAEPTPEPAPAPVLKPAARAETAEKPVPREKAAETDDAGLFPFDPDPASTPEPAPEPVVKPVSGPETVDKPVPEPAPEPVGNPVSEPEPEKKADCLLLKDVSFKTGKGSFEMDVIANCAIREYKHFYVGSPPKLVVDLRGTWKRQTRPEHVVEDSDLVSQVRIGLHPEFVRLVVDLKGNEKITPLLRETPQGMSVSIRRK